MFARLRTLQPHRMSAAHAWLLSSTCASLLLLISPSPPARWATFNWAGEKSFEAETAADAALQQAATNALDGREGAIIVMDPHTGRIRAVVNSQAAYSQALMPGSTMKPFTALAALRAGLIDKDSRTVCPGRFTGRNFSLACVHDDHLPPFGPSQAIAYSCNYYFATLGQRLGRDALIETMRSFGFGQPKGLADAGTLRPCEAGNGARIIDGESNHTSQADCDAREAIGESDHIQVTPLQLLTGYSALVNGGRVLQPAPSQAASFEPVERGRVEISDRHRAIIIEGMRGAVRYGTARNAHLDSLPLYVFGKTGTSVPAKGFRSNGWFIGFAAHTQADSPAEPAPREIDLAVLILLTRSHGSEAATLAKPIFEAYQSAGTNNQSEISLPDQTSSDIDQSEIRNPKSEIQVHLVTQNLTQGLSLEDYVLGVLRAEGSMETQPEAMKALAIAIRTYALKNRGRHAKDGYDFCTTTHCQRFLPSQSRSPAAGEGAMAAAVRATEGQVLLDDQGQVVDSYFGASCGGETANLGTLWGKTPPGYLRGVHDEFCLLGAHANWTDTITRANLLRALQSDPRTDAGAKIDQVTVSKRDETGRAQLITIDGDHQKVVRGWDFKIIVGRVLGWNLLKSSRFGVTRVGSNFIFRGSGFGHGLGLCQEGAHVMAGRGSSYQRILEKYFPGTTLLPRSGNVSLARPFRAGTSNETDQLVESATIDSARQPSLKRRTKWCADVIPALKGRAKFIRRYAEMSTKSPMLTISSEHFRVTYPADVDRRDADQVLSTLESARADYLRRTGAASISITEIPRLEIRLNESTGDFSGRTGQPWWAAAATKGNRIELQPVAILKRRGVLTSTLRHELAHTIIDSINKHAPRWLAEGFALYLAGEGKSISRYATKAKLTVEELEQRLEHPKSQDEMRALYAAAYSAVVNLISTEGEGGVWRRVAGS
jgi:SpoIID/LytB domain protein